MTYGSTSYFLPLGDIAEVVVSHNSFFSYVIISNSSMVIQVGMAANLRDFVLTNCEGKEVYINSRG